MKSNFIAKLFQRTILVAVIGLGIGQILAHDSEYIDPKYRSLDLQDITPYTKEFMKQLREAKKQQQAASGAEEVKDYTNPYFPVDPIRGYIDIYDKDNSMWYWLASAKKNPEKAPIIIFFQGGPGGASSGDYVGPSGPFEFKNYSDAHPRAYFKEGNTSWTENAHVLYPDFPLGVGFSTVTSEGLSYDGKQVQEQIVIFYQKFLEVHPEFKGRAIYVAGISYGGHWVPYAASALKYSDNPDINVQGFYISSGLMDYEKAADSYIPFALKNLNYTGLTQEQAARWQKLADLCRRMSYSPNPLYTVDRFNVCQIKGFLDVMTEIRKQKPKFNNKDISGGNTNNFDLSPDLFLNNSKVLAFAGVKQKQFEPMNNTFFKFFAPRNMFTLMEPLMARLLNDGVKGVVAAGTLDFICNYMQSEASVADVRWKWQKAYNKVKMTPCHGGVCKEFKNLREYRVDGSGHEICYFKPEIAAEIVRDLIDWQPEK